MSQSSVSKYTATFTICVGYDGIYHQWHEAHHSVDLQDVYVVRNKPVCMSLKPVYAVLEFDLFSDLFSAVRQWGAMLKHSDQFSMN